MLTNRGVFISAVTHNTRTSTHTFTYSRESLKSKNATEMTNRGVLIYVIIHNTHTQCAKSDQKLSPDAHWVDLNTGGN